jgi:hypothetical protein
MDDLFTRLEKMNNAASPQAKKDTALAGPDKSMFSFDDGPSTPEVKKEPAASRPTKSGTGAAFGQPSVKDEEEEEQAADLKKILSDGVSRLAKEKEEAEKKAELARVKAELARADEAKADKAAEIRRVGMAQVFQDAEERMGISQEDPEDNYMRKAREYVDALPDSKGNTALLIKTVSKKLRSTFVPDIKLDYENNEIIKTRFAFVIANYLKQILKEGLEPRTTDSVKQTLKDVDGDFLRLCARLVDEKHISLKTLDGITGLVNNVLNILPKAEPFIAAIAKETKPVAKETKSVVKDTKPVSNDPVDDMTAWPTQAKRENRKSPS